MVGGDHWPHGLQTLLRKHENEEKRADGGAEAVSESYAVERPVVEAPTASTCPYPAWLLSNPLVPQSQAVSLIANEEINRRSHRDREFRAA